MWSRGASGSPRAKVGPERTWAEAENRIASRRPSVKRKNRAALNRLAAETALVSEAESPHVSVCIPVFNGGPFVGRAIASVLSQGLTDLELIVADNASTDDTLAVVATFSDPRLRVLRSEENMGAGRNWNRAVRAARGDHVKLLCADDWLYTDCLARQVEVLEAPENRGVVLVASARDIVDSRGRRVMRRGWRGPTRVVPGRQAVRRMARRGANLVGEPSATLFRRREGLAAGLFDEQADYVVDVAFWWRLLLLGDLCVMEDVLSAFRVQNDSWSVAAASRQAADMRNLLISLIGDPRYGLRRWEARLGAARAVLDARARRLVYALLARRSSPE